MPPETIDVPQSEDGNGLPPVAPIENVDPTTEPVEPVAPVAPTEPELFELPDGRKVDAQTLSKEWKENFYPDYTRKSQALAEKKDQPITTPAQNPLADPNFQPQSYEELAKHIQEQTLQALASKEQERIEKEKAVETEISTQIETLKQTDPNLNENALFLHANKYGFRDLTVAYKNMKDMSQIVKDVKQATAEDIKKRQDPVSVQSGNSGGTAPNPANFASATDFLRSLTKT